MKAPPPMLSSATLLMPGCAVASAVQRPPAEPSARAVFERFVDLLYRRRQVRAAFESCVVARGFVDHGAACFGSRAGAMAQLGEHFARDDAQVQVLHTVFDGDVGMVHVQLTPRDGQPVHRRVDIFRVAEGRIVEHWELAS